MEDHHVTGHFWEVRKARLKPIIHQIVTSHDFSDRGAGNTDSWWAGISESQWTLTFHLSNSFGHKSTDLGGKKKVILLNWFLVPPPQLTVCLVVSQPGNLPEWVSAQLLLKESVDLSDDWHGCFWWLVLALLVHRRSFCSHWIPWRLSKKS